MKEVVEMNENNGVNQPSNAPTTIENGVKWTLVTRGFTTATRLTISFTICVLLLVMRFFAQDGFSRGQASAGQQKTKGQRISTWGSRDPDEPALLTVIREGDMKAVVKIVSSGTILDFSYRRRQNGVDRTSSTQGISPLALAVSSGHADILLFLLEHGASPNFCEPGGDTPLMVAAFLNDIVSVNTLLRFGANLDERDKDGETALLLAASNATGKRIVEVLVAEGANPHATDAAGNNALMLAAAGHNLDAVDFLSRQSIDACASNLEGQTALEMAKGNLNAAPAKSVVILFLATKCPRKAKVQ